MKYQSVKTRKLILETAFQEIHRNGFRATSLDDILEKTGLTKGAFYHHFSNKLSLGYAIIDELIKKAVYGVWIKPFETCDNPIDCMIKLLTTVKMDKNTVLEGCPLNNLAVEMAPIDEGFRQRLKQIYDMWITVTAGSLARGIRNGMVRSDIDTYETAVFIVASIAGCRSLAKNDRRVEMLKICHNTLIMFLETLRVKRE